MEKPSGFVRPVPALVRVVLALALGLAVGLVAPPPVGWMWGWTAGALLFVVWSLAAVWRMDPAQTLDHAGEEEPGRAALDAALILASVASIGGVGALLVSAHGGPDAWVEAAAGVAGVTASWLLVHTLFALRYARLYAAEGGAPIDFGDDDPDYHDFFYLAFTLGMTYQVSDTTLKKRSFRRAALRHALLSYLLGAVIVASTVNLLVQLAG